MDKKEQFTAITEEEILSTGAYEIENHRFLKDINSDSYILRHKKTGARVAILPNSDSNKVFYVGFRTPPIDSTGVAHIIEHTVLCGSRDFPVKDPFVEVVKGSLNTFLNAMTYPDKTVYPVASTNEKDFDNLMHVYLDAVFHPNIYTNENIFRQEGWHYEDKDGEISVNGVVYNEMKGVMSSPDDVLGDKVMASLYPDTTYSIVSGGDPEVIPSLTYENYLDFHRKYYHPSNSYVYLYGDMDMQERLTYLDKEYLGTYDRIQVDSGVNAQKAFDQPVEESYHYAVQEGEDLSGKTYLSYNVSLPIGGNQKETLAFKILDYVLCDAEGGPVKEAVRKAGIGEDCSSLFESGILQPFYSITAKYADPDQKDLFIAAIENKLKELVTNGLDRKSLLAGINYYEFHYREADFGMYPKGLILGLDALDTWLYDVDPWQNLEIGPLFAELKEEIEKGYFEDLITRLLLDNQHKSVVLLTPEAGMTERMDAAQKEKMAAYAASLSEEEREAIVDAQESLRLWQETPDPQENVEKIPILAREDLGKESLRYANVEEKAGSVKMLTHPVFTSGIDYVDMIFDVTDIPARLYPYLSVFKVLLCVLDTEHYSYAELDHEINIVTGGVTPSISTYTMAKNTEDYRVTFEVSMKTMHSNFQAAMDLLEEILLRTKFEDRVRIREVLEEERSANRSELPSNGHGTAVTRATSYFNVTSKIVDDLSGIGAYRMLDQICTHLADEEDTAYFDNFARTLQELAEWIFAGDRLLFDITQEADKIQEVVPVIEAFGHRLHEPRTSSEEAFVPVLTRKDEGFTTAGQIQFVCRAGSFKDKGLAYTGSLRVLKSIMGYDYLWKTIRMKGGAYGCMSGFSKDGTAFFVTYRDPHLGQSVEVFEQAADYVRNFEADERTMTKYVIGAISAIDRPLSPFMYGRYSMTGYVTGYTDEDVQKERDQVLATDVSDIRALGDYIDAFMKDGNVTVIGSAQKIDQYKDMFKNVEALIG